HKIQTPVNTIGAINIRTPGRAKHGSVALAGASVGMGCGFRLIVSFYLNDNSAHTIYQKVCADKLGRYQMRRSGKINHTNAYLQAAELLTRCDKFARRGTILSHDLFYNRSTSLLIKPMQTNKKAEAKSRFGFV